MNTEKPLQDKVALITGASRGIGRATALRLALMGARVSLCARDAKRLESAASECERAGSEAIAVPADVSRAADITKLLETTERQLGPVEILVNNAGVGYFGPIQNGSESNWDEVLDTNLKAVFLLSRAVVPGMIGMGTGNIVNIASLAGKNVFAGGGIYCASKWGLLGLSGCMAEDLRAHGIRVSAICPGSVATEFGLPGGRDRSKMLQPDDVAHAVAMILTQAPQSFISEVSLRPTQKP
ncbi:MAG: SDR family NAD(P)-dependent oxidoreductase [Candidatus Acidiferrales bacterium]